MHTMPIKGRKKKEIILSFLSIALIISIDQSTKLLIRHNLKIGDSIPILKNILHITFVSNTGAAFSLFKNSTLLFVLVSIIAILIISRLIIRSINRGDFLHNIGVNISFILILSGALGNLIDRLNLSYVVDFIDVRIWPVFNIADISITIGTFLLVCYYAFPGFLKK